MDQTLAAFAQTVPLREFSHACIHFPVLPVVVPG